MSVQIKGEVGETVQDLDKAFQVGGRCGVKYNINTLQLYDVSTDQGGGGGNCTGSG